MASQFSLLGCDGLARLGSFETTHGKFSTPNFMPVGTRASVRGVDIGRLREIGTEVTLVNTYHLWVRPGPELIQKLGGIQKFSAFDGPVLSDSGGFQIFSLSKIRTLSEEGVEFRSHVDGKAMKLTPELCVKIQEQLGVDIAMALDECPPAGIDQKTAEQSLELTLRWAKRCLAARTRTETALFGITQGGTHRDLRTRSAAEIGALPFDGVAVGGLSVGESKQKMYEVLSYHVQQLPSAKIRYLMGVGTPGDIIEAVRQGIDLFDCVMPTRSGRFGRAFINAEFPYINIKNAEHVDSDRPLDEGCDCIACRHYSRAYINHLFRVGEMLGPSLVSIHNLRHYLALMFRIRESIKLGKFSELYTEVSNRWAKAEIGMGDEAAVSESE